MEDINKLSETEIEQVSGGGGAIHNKGSLTIPDTDEGWYVADRLEPSTAYAPVQRGWADTDESDL